MGNQFIAAEKRILLEMEADEALEAFEQSIPLFSFDKYCLAEKTCMNLENRERMIGFLQDAAILIEKCQMNDRVKNIVLKTLDERMTRARLGMVQEEKL